MAKLTPWLVIIAWTALVIALFVWFNPPQGCPLIDYAQQCDSLAPPRNLLIGGLLLAWGAGMLVIVSVARRGRH